MTLALLIVASYLFGSIPYGLYLGKLLRGVDLREAGSGNIGATNAWRVLGWQIGLPVFLLDMAKGLLPVLTAKHFNYPDWFVIAAGIGAILGHNFSPFLNFKGGKGVATSLGVSFGMSWKAGIAGFLAFAVTVGVTRYISLGSMIGTLAGALGIWHFNGHTLPYAIFGIIANIFVIVKHKANMERLAKGTEPKVGAKKEIESA